MNVNEKEALLRYLEFHLLKFVEAYEPHITDPDIMSDMYDRAYGVLVDMEQTIAAQTEIQQVALSRVKKRSS